MARVIIFSSDTQYRMEVQRILEPLGAAISIADNKDSLQKLLKAGNFDLLILVHQENDLNAANTLEHLPRKNLPPTVVLALKCTIEDAIRIMQAGAEDVILAPWVGDQVIECCKKAILSKTVRSQRITTARKNKKRQIIWKSEVMGRVLEIAESVSRSRASILIQGESGTGKELLARYIHDKSDRANGPFVAINCASLPETLLESELFGHEKGAFTGALNMKKGRFELAHGGTILLDEITEMAFPLQAKLLRVLQEGEIDRVGGTRPIPVDVRVIATTNKDIKKVIEDGEFREDLYFRLNVIPLTLPPLRERVEDIEALAMHFLEEFSREYGKSGLVFAKKVVEVLKMRPWPGNIRELRNIVERGVLLATGSEVTLDHLFFDERDELIASQSKGAFSWNFNEMFNLQDVEREVIKRALSKTGGNRTHAARLLGISVRTLRNKLSEYREMGLVL